MRGFFWCSLATAVAYSAMLPVFALTLRLGMMDGDLMGCGVGLLGLTACGCGTWLNLARAWRTRNE